MRVFIAIGLSGSGKSTFLREFAKIIGAVLINYDSIRAQVENSNFYFANNRTKNVFIWEEIILPWIKHALKLGQVVIVDSTNVYHSERVQLIQNCKQMSAGQVIGIFFNTDFKICLARQSNPDRQIHLDDEALSRQLEHLSGCAPSFQDGFQRLFVIINNQVIRELAPNDHICLK